ncbi:MAG TPA: hypothetical protein VKU80_03445 [Planctomycetota bacterium]|nr:hypothetical protein [Planctomycetota bacterium]
MSCLAEERFVELLDRGGLEASSPEEGAHLRDCQACRESWATVAAAGEVLAQAGTRGAGRLVRAIPLVAAAMLLAAIAVIVIRHGPSSAETPVKDPLGLILEGSPDEAKGAREALLKSGRKALPGLVAARPRLRTSLRFGEIQDLIWTLKIGGVQGTPDEAVVRKMEHVKIDLAFENVGVNDILAYLRDLSDINYVLDPTVDPGPVERLRGKNQSLRSTLETLCLVKDIDFDFRYGVVFLSRPMRLWSTEPGVGMPESNVWRTQALDPAGLEVAGRLPKNPITLDVQNCPMSAVAQYISTLSGVPIELPEALGETMVTLKVQTIHLVRLVELLTLPRGWDARIEGRSLVFFARAK